MRYVLPMIAALMLSACASVPGDGGLADVQQAASERAGMQWAASTEALVQDELTADEAVAIATANSARLQVELAELGIARADLIEASTISNPLLEFEIRFPGDPYRPYELRLAQSLVELVQLPRRRAIGRLAFDSAKLRVTSEVLRFGAGVRADYYDLLAASQHAALTQVLFDAAQASAELALKQHVAGNITDLDLENEQALYEQAKLDLARAEQSLVIAREKLLRAMGTPALRIALPSAFPELPETELDEQQLTELARSRRLDIDLARRDIELARRNVPLARLAALGEVEVDVHYEREPDGARSIGPGIELPLPIFNTGRAARTRAEAELLRARHTLDALEAESASVLRTSRATLSEARARVEYYRDVVVPRRKRITALTTLEHNAMLVGVFQLLQAKQNEVQALRDFIDAQRDYWIARNDLDRAINGIGDDTMFNPATDQGPGKRANISRGGH